MYEVKASMISKHAIPFYGHHYRQSFLQTVVADTNGLSRLVFIKSKLVVSLLHCLLPSFFPIKLLYSSKSVLSHAIISTQCESPK